MSMWFCEVRQGGSVLLRLSCLIPREDGEVGFDFWDLSVSRPP